MNADQPPPKVAPRLKSAPKIREFFWCDFPLDAQLPEFWKRRPVIIISKTAKLHGTANIIPCSTQSQPHNKWAYPLRTTIDGKAAWAICDKIGTVAVSRLSPDKDGIKRMDMQDFNSLLSLLYKWLPTPQE